MGSISYQLRHFWYIVDKNLTPHTDVWKVRQLPYGQIQNGVVLQCQTVRYSPTNEVAVRLGPLCDAGN